MNKSDKLTVESVTHEILKDFITLKHLNTKTERHIWKLLKQIRDEIINGTSYSSEHINNVFNKYLNEKGGK